MAQAAGSLQFRDDCHSVAVTLAGIGLGRLAREDEGAGRIGSNTIQTSKTRGKELLVKSMKLGRATLP
jgi:hypothetical protein